MSEGIRLGKPLAHLSSTYQLFEGLLLSTGKAVTVLKIPQHDLDLEILESVCANAAAVLTQLSHPCLLSCEDLVRDEENLLFVFESVETNFDSLVLSFGYLLPERLVGFYIKQLVDGAPSFFTHPFNKSRLACEYVVYRLSLAGKGCSIFSKGGTRPSKSVPSMCG